MSTVQTKQTNLREKLAELLDFRKMRDRLSGLGLYIGKDRTGTGENLLVRGGANVDDLQIGEIAALVGGTAVDVFVYDTSRDSDGGAWRKRTQHTSWYNEELNTATRGGRREFPAVVLVVTEADRVVLYDADDSDLSMWMIFNTVDIDSSSGNYNVLGHTGREATKGTAMNGEFLFCSKNNQNQTYINFITEQSLLIYQTIDIYKGNISQRNNNAHYIGYMDIPGGRFAQNHAIVDRNVHDVAMTVLPNARIDQNTGLPVPTIAVATDGGVSVIKDDGTVVDLNVYDRPYSSVYFSGNVVWAVENPETDYDLLRYFEIPTSDITAASSYGPNSSPALFPENTKGNIFDSFNYGSPIGITKLDHEGSMVAYTTSKYNTGWMPGDIKLATLSDTTVETIGVNSDNLVTNGGFDTDTIGWSGISGGFLSIDNGRLKIEETTNVNDAYAINSSVISTVVGKRYLIEWQFIKGTNTGFSVRFGNSGDQTLDYKSNTTGEYTVDGYYSFEFIATGTELNLSFIVNEPNTYGFLDNVSVRETTELITNGDFSIDTSGWTQENGTISRDNSIFTNGGLKVISDGAQFPMASQQITGLVVGQKYILSADAYVPSGNPLVSAATISIDNPAPGASGSSTDWAYVSTKNQTNTLTVTFTATAITADLYLLVLYPTVAWGVDGDVAYFDNISVRPAVEDRSANNNGLQIIGEINKAPVAPGADLVAYSGFSADNYLVQPYNADLDFGAGDFCVMGWFKSYVSSDAGIIYSRRPQSSNINGLEIGVNTDGTLYVYTIEDSRENSSGTPLTGKPITRNVWNNFCAVRSGETINLYVNGALHSSGTNTIRDLTNASAELCLGIYGDQSSVAFDGEISLIRASTTTPTPDQIAKIYRDEKALFTDGAQATLYGTSDAVTALAYDDKTELLHVGTSGGRSDFAGLRRINNTTTAITTSISAHNNLIAEQ